MAGSYLDAEDLNMGHIDKKTFFSSHDRAILEAAANRVCFDCGLNDNGAPCTDECSERKAILATLNKE